MPISEFWLHYWRQIIFFTVPLSNIIFFSQNQSKEIFFEKIPSPSPEYQMDRALLVIDVGIKYYYWQGLVYDIILLFKIINHSL